MGVEVMKIRRKSDYLPHPVIEHVVDNHPAIDPDTGHLLCHYKPIGLALVEVGGETYPALTVGDCVTVVNDPAAIKAITSETEPLETSILPPPDPEYRDIPVHEIASILSALRDAAMVEVRRPRDTGEYLILILRDNYEIAFILERCKRHEDKGAILQV